jgi:hypothetical protein
MVCGYAQAQVAFPGSGNTANVNRIIIPNFNVSTTITVTAWVLDWPTTVRPDSRYSCIFATDWLQTEAYVLYLSVTNTLEGGAKGGGQFQLKRSVTGGLTGTFFVANSVSIVNTQCLLYVNAQLQDSYFPYGVGSIATFSNTSYRIVAQQTQGQTTLGGKLEDLRVYTRVLSASEIASIYRNPYALINDPALVVRTCIASGDTGASLAGIAQNYGYGPDGSYSNAPTVAAGRIQTSKPLTMRLP